MAEENLKALWAKAKERGWTYPQAAAAVRKRFQRKCSGNTVQGLIVRNVGGEDLRKHVRTVLDEFLATPKSVDYGHSESVEPEVARLVDRPENIAPEEWRLRAIQSEEKLTEVHSILRAAIRLIETHPKEIPWRKVSSKQDADVGPILDEAEKPSGDPPARPGH